MGVTLMRTSEEEKVVAIAKISGTNDDKDEEQLTLEACADNAIDSDDKDMNVDLLAEEVYEDTEK